MHHHVYGLLPRCTTYASTHTLVNSIFHNLKTEEKKIIRTESCYYNMPEEPLLCMGRAKTRSFNGTNDYYYCCCCCFCCIAVSHHRFSVKVYIHIRAYEYALLRCYNIIAYLRIDVIVIKYIFFLYGYFITTALLGMTLV